MSRAVTARCSVWIRGYGSAGWHTISIQTPYHDVCRDLLNASDGDMIEVEDVYGRKHLLRASEIVKVCE